MKSKYLCFTKPDGTKVRILKGVVVEFDLWVGAANAEQTCRGVSNEIAEKAIITIGDDTWYLSLDNKCVDAKSLRNIIPSPFGLMLRSICMTQIMKHCEEY